MTRKELKAYCERRGLFLTMWRPGDSKMYYKIGFVDKEYFELNHDEASEAVGLAEAERAAVGIVQYHIWSTVKRCDEDMENMQKSKSFKRAREKELKRIKQHGYGA